METKSFIIEASRNNSIESQNNITTTDSYARWTNEVSQVKVEPGHAVNIQLTCLNVVGADSNQTIEIDGTMTDKGVVNDRFTMRFVPYVVNNGYNFCPLPFCASSERVYKATKSSSINDYWIPWCYQKVGNQFHHKLVQYSFGTTWNYPQKINNYLHTSTINFHLSQLGKPVESSHETNVGTTYSTNPNGSAVLAPLMHFTNLGASICTHF